MVQRILRRTFQLYKIAKIVLIYYKAEDGVKHFHYPVFPVGITGKECFIAMIVMQ